MFYFCFNDIVYCFDALHHLMFFQICVLIVKRGIFGGSPALLHPPGGSKTGVTIILLLVLE